MRDKDRDRDRDRNRDREYTSGEIAAQLNMYRKPYEGQFIYKVITSTNRLREQAGEEEII